MFPDLRSPKGYVGLILMLAMLAAPLALGTPFWTNLFVLLFVFSALSVAWNIVGGYAGQLSLGHAVFYGIGGYTATLLTQNFGISPWFGMLAGAVISAAVAVVISYPTLRLRGLLRAGDHRHPGGGAPAGDPRGKLDRRLQRHQPAAEHRLDLDRVPREGQLRADRLRAVRAGDLGVLVHAQIAHRPLPDRHPRTRDAALAVGIHTVRMKIIAAVVSAMLTSIVGAFHITYLTFVDPSSAFSLELSVQVAMFALIGGLGTVAGPIAGTFLVLPIAELARGWLSSVGNGMHGLIYGLILVAVVLTIPRGLAGAFGPMIERWLARLPYLGAPRRPATPPQQARPAGPAAAGQPVLKADRLFKSFGGLRATNDVSLTLNQNEILGMIGPNGAGKTTVFNLLSGFLSPDQGSVSMLNARGEWVSCKTPDAFAHQGLGRTFQIAKPFTGLTVLENIMLGAFIRTSSRDEAEQIALRVAEQTDLTRHLDTEARNLTVGGMKRLEVARALAIQPRILLLDEVMAGLNPTDIEKSIQMIRRIRDSGVSVLLIEHMMQATMALSDRIVVLNEGAVLVSGAPRDVVENPAVIEAYLGKEYQDA